MKRLFRSSVTAICLTLFAAYSITTTEAAGLLFDSSFESGVAVPGGVGGWDLENGAAFSTTVAHTGTHSMADFGANGVPINFQFLPALPGSQWDLTGFGYTPGMVAQTSGPVFGIIQLTFFSGPNGTGTDLGTVQTSPGTAKASAQINSDSPVNTWIPLDTGVVTAPAGAQSIAAYSLVVNFTSLTTAPQGAYFDDLTLVQVPEPGSAGLLACGLVGLGLASKRRRA